MDTDEKRVQRRIDHAVKETLVKVRNVILEIHKDVNMEDPFYSHECSECGSYGEYGIEYPCDTVRSIQRLIDKWTVDHGENSPFNTTGGTIKATPIDSYIKIIKDRLNREREIITRQHADGEVNETVTTKTIELQRNILATIDMWEQNINYWN